LSIISEERFEAHIYLNHHYPPIQWNIVRGLFHSPDCLPESKGAGFISISMATMLLNDTAERLNSELLLDEFRRSFYPDHVSRLKGIFVFDDIDSLSNLWKNNNWGGHFCDEYLADVGVSAIKSSRLDSNWISEIFDSSGNLKINWDAAAHNYWQGVCHPEKPPIWERIVEGAITVWSMDSKVKALQDIQSIWPKSLNLLRYAILCASYGSFDGEVFPFLRITENSLNISYYLRMVQRGDSEFINSLNKFITENPLYDTNIGNSGDDHLPDLSGFNRELTANSDGLFGEIVAKALSARTENQRT